jgi:hypothetical protein
MLFFGVDHDVDPARHSIFVASKCGHVLIMSEETPALPGISFFRLNVEKLPEVVDVTEMKRVR